MGLGCIGFLPNRVKKKYQEAVRYCQKLNPKAHLIEIFNGKQQKYLIHKFNLLNHLGKYNNRYNKNKGNNFWLGAELWRSNWYWTRWGKKVRYVPNSHPLDNEYTQAYAYMSLTKKTVQWKADRTQDHDGNPNGDSTDSTQSLRPLCQISRETRQRSKNLGK